MPELTHMSYLLRIWRSDTRSPWHVMVVDVARPDEHQHFATLDALLAFLFAQTRPVPLVSEQMSKDAEHYTPSGNLSPRDTLHSTISDAFNNDQERNHRS
jgi:hypothetical protein